MSEVHLRPVTLANYRECLALQVEDSQTGLIPSNAKSLAEAYVNPNMMPLAVYDVAARGFEEPPTPMVGFMMIEMAAGVGFITRLMIDRAHQGKGYGRAAGLPCLPPKHGDSFGGLEKDDGGQLVFFRHQLRK